jgi:uncharacterized membrane protein
MSAPVDINGLVEQAQATLTAVDAVVAQLGTIAETLQTVLNQAVTVEQDADGVIKSVHVKWPLN